MLPKGAAVSVLAVGSVTAVLGGGYLLQQQPRETAGIVADAGEEPPDVPLPETPATDATPPPAGGAGAAAPRPPSGGGGSAAQGAAPRPSGAPAAPAQGQKSTVDRLIEMLGRPSAPPAAVPGPAVPGGLPAPPGTPAAGATGGAAPEPPVPPENFGPTANPRENYRKVIVPPGQVVEVVFMKDLSSAEAKVESPIEARITRTYRVGEDMALPENTRLVGVVAAVEQQGAVKGRGRIDFRFYRLRLPDGSAVAIETPMLRYEGPAPASGAAKKAGGAAIGGAVVGILLGGTSGAIKGATAGAAAATAGAVGKEPEPVVIPAETPFDVRIVSNVRVYLPIKARP